MWLAFGSSWPELRYTPHRCITGQLDIWSAFGSGLQSEQEQYFVRSAWHLQSDIPSSDVPPYKHLMDKTRTELGPVDLSSDIPPVEASSDQEQYYVRSEWDVVSLWVRLTWAQMYPLSRGIQWSRAVLPQVSLTCAVRCTQVRCTPPVEASHGQDQNWVRSSWPELRCTPPHESHIVAKTTTQLCLVDLSSDVPFSDFFP